MFQTMPLLGALGSEMVCAPRKMSIAISIIPSRILKASNSVQPLSSQLTESDLFVQRITLLLSNCSYETTRNNYACLYNVHL